jgi:hypothetical protein
MNSLNAFDKIRRGKIRRVFISAYNDKANGYDENFLKTAEALSRQRTQKHPLEVFLFDADSADVWGGHSE